MRISTDKQLSTPVTLGTATNKKQSFTSLEDETRSHVETACAAFHLSRRTHTLHVWACYGNGAIRPTRINGRLAWSVADIKRALNGGEQ